MARRGLAHLLGDAAAEAELVVAEQALSESGRLAAALGALYQKQGRLREALKTYERAESRLAGEALVQLRHQMASILINLNRFDDAIAAYNSILVEGA